MWGLVDNPESIALTESFYNSGKPWLLSVIRRRSSTA